MAVPPDVPGPPWPVNARVTGEFAVGPSFVRWTPMDLPGGRGLIMQLHTPQCVVVSFWDEPSGRFMLNQGLEALSGIQTATDDDVIRLLRPNGGRN